MQYVTYGAAIVCLCMSLALLFTMGADKRYARTGGRRVPEKRLFTLALLLGAPGGLLGMYAFHHKTKHWYFVAGFWRLTLVQLGALVWLALRYVR